MSTDRIAQLEAALRRAEWGDHVHKWSPAQDGHPKCPWCGGWRPSEHDGRTDSATLATYDQHLGHRSDCAWVALGISSAPEPRRVFVTFDPTMGPAYFESSDEEIARMLELFRGAT